MRLTFRSPSVAPGPSRPLTAIPVLLLVALIAAPTAAYTIYLEDGTRILAKEKYTVNQEGQAIIVLQSGLETFIDASEIDVERTERVNRLSIGTAEFLEEDGTVTEIRREPETGARSLRDLIDQGVVGTNLPERQAVQQPRPRAEGEASRQTTLAGHPDLTAFETRPLPDFDRVAAIRELLAAQGLEQVKVLQGTLEDRVFLEITTNSEATVFRALEAAAETLRSLEESGEGPGISAFELLMLTSSRERAGQFLLTPADAEALAEGRVDLPTFFLSRVQF